jgi:transcriptional regulator with XRE-family HTH domain
MSRTIFEGYFLRGSLIGRIRRSLRLTQGRFAAALSVSEASVANWERGRNKPSPASLKRMAELAPALAPEIGEVLKSYEWHERPIAERDLHELPGDISGEVQRLAKKHGLDTSVILLQALRTGLAALSRDSSPAWKTLVKRQADIARRVEDREHPAESSRKHRRSKVA